VIGGITLVRLEHEGDYHIALADPADTSYTIVTGVADIACQGAIRSPYRGALESARNSWVAILGSRSPSSAVGMTVRGSWSGILRPRSRSDGQVPELCVFRSIVNGMELHPILSIQP
jgi:hypothetical protein